MCALKRPALFRMSGRSGQSMVESCIVMAMMSLIFFVMLQISQLFAAQEILDYAAFKGARARTVGFNDFMVYKVVRIGSIANAGKLSNPVFQRSSPLAGQIDSLDGGDLWQMAVIASPGSEQYEIESSRIPEYLAAEHWGHLQSVLDYENWNSIHAWNPAAVQAKEIDFNTSQDVPLWVPLHKAFIDADSISMHGESRIENHSELYLE